MAITALHCDAIDFAGPGSHDAGNDVGQDASPTPIDDGGAVRLADGAIVYQYLWDRPCPADSTLTYESFGQQFFAQYCTHCHSRSNEGLAREGAPTEVNFDTLDDIRPLAAAAWAQAADNHMTMPEAGAKPSLDERRMLGDWLACGAVSSSDDADR